MAKLNRRWFAAYVKSRHEKQVYEFLQAAGIRAFLPTQKVLREWSDRKKMVDEPLFKGYIFVRILKRDFTNVRSIPGIVGFVTFEREPAIVSDKEIDNIKRALKGREPVEVSHEALEPGIPIRVLFGPLQGLEGELVEIEGKKRVAVRINHLSQSLLVKVPPFYLKSLVKQNIV